MRQNRNRLIAVIVVAGLLAAAFAARSFLDKVYDLPILMYHSIDYTDDNKIKTIVAPEAFEGQMKYLREKGYRIIALEEAVKYIKEGRGFPRKTVAITLDDGYKNVQKYAYPVLKRYDIPATVFVMVGLTGTGAYLDWPQIEELSRSGIIDIESHTVSHPWLTGLDDVSLKKELIESKKVLEEKLGKTIRYLCYPMGGYDERVKQAVKEAGYEAAFATKSRSIFPCRDPYEIKRIRVSATSNNLLVFRLKVSGYHSFFKVITR